MTGMRTRRKVSPVYFDNGWADGYLAGRADGGGPSLCRVLDTNVRDWRVRAADVNRELEGEPPVSLPRLRPSHRRSLDGKRADLKVVDGLVARWAYPWVTPVVGPGCLDTSDESQDTGDETGPSLLARRPAALAEAATRWELLLPTGADPSEIVERFAWALIERKLANPPRRPDPVDRDNGTSVELNDAQLGLTARLVLCAALAAWLYNQAAALTGAPPFDDAEPVAITEVDELGEVRELGAELYRTVARPLRTELELLAGATEVAFVQTFADAVAHDLAPGVATIRRTDATMLAELAWHQLTRDTTHYAGWREVLLYASMQSGNADRHMRWPHVVNRAGLGLLDWLTNGMETTTTKSWKTREELVWTPRDALYDAVADVITEQARLRRLTNYETGSQTAFLPGVAFVTSLDLELEMALLSKRTDFVMLVPFEVIRTDDPDADAHLLWLYTVVRPETEGIENVDQLRTRTGWQFVDPAGFLQTLHTDAFPEDEEKESDDVSRPMGLPIVVRLAGSPLVKPPTAAPKGAGPLLKAQGIAIAEEEPNYRLQPAVVVDELSALLHISADHGAFTDENGNVYRSGLPEDVLRNWVAEKQSAESSDSAGKSRKSSRTTWSFNRDTRFWLVMGVQIGDSAIRARIASLLSAAGIETPEDFRTGVAVVRRSQPADRDVLHWLGLDVVSDQAFAVVDDLRHYTRHLERYPYDRRVDLDCPLETRSY